MCVCMCLCTGVRSEDSNTLRSDDRGTLRSEDRSTRLCHQERCCRCQCKCAPACVCGVVCVARWLHVLSRLNPASASSCCLLSVGGVSPATLSSSDVTVTYVMCDVFSPCLPHHRWRRRVSACREKATAAFAPIHIFLATAQERPGDGREWRTRNGMERCGAAKG